MNIDWDKITIYEVDPFCVFPYSENGYVYGCRCSRCTDVMRRKRGRTQRKPRYIPESEWQS